MGDSRINVVWVILGAIFGVLYQIHWDLQAVIKLLEAMP